MLDQITHLYEESLLELLVFFHFLFDEGDGFGWDIAAVVVEAVELPQKGENGVADPAAQLIVISPLLFEGEVLLEECDFGHFSLEVGSIFEEIAFVELIEFIPNFCTTIGHLLILLFSDDSLIFL